MIIKMELSNLTALAAYEKQTGSDKVLRELDKIYSMKIENR